jgi:hypothetical protein
MSFLDRGPADTILALALIHHLAISNNLPFDKLAEFFSGCCESLVIEFVPKSDPPGPTSAREPRGYLPRVCPAKLEREFGILFRIDQAVKITDRFVDFPRMYSSFSSLRRDSGPLPYRSLRYRNLSSRETI